MAKSDGRQGNFNSGGLILTGPGKGQREMALEAGQKSSCRKEIMPWIRTGGGPGGRVVRGRTAKGRWRSSDF